jgi:hypothetical protein
MWPEEDLGGQRADVRLFACLVSVGWLGSWRACLLTRQFFERSNASLVAGQRLVNSGPTPR